MNQVNSIPLAKALEDVESIKLALSKVCSKVLVAGSIRREKPYVKDIELVCSPIMESAAFLFDELAEKKRIPGFAREVNKLGKVLNAISPLEAKQLGIILPNGHKLDLFIPNEHDFFRQYAIRTGSAEWSHKVLAGAWKRNGWIGTPDGLRLIAECEIENFKFKRVLAEKPTLPPVWKSEYELFQWLGISWKTYGNPKNRNA